MMGRCHASAIILNANSVHHTSPRTGPQASHAFDHVGCAIQFAVRDVERGPMESLGLLWRGTRG